MGVDLPLHRIAHRIRDHDASRLGKSLEPRRYVHAVAIDRAISLLDHVAQVDADAKAHLPPVGHPAGHDAE